MTEGFALPTEDHYFVGQYLPVRVLTYNVKGGEGGDGRFGGKGRDYLALDHVADLVASLAPDVVALQEICVNGSQGETADQIAHLGARLGMYHAFAPVEHASLLYGGQVGGRDFWGNAVLSRFPIASFHVHEFASGRPNDERSALETRIQVGDYSFAFFSTHLSYIWRTTFAQSRELAAIVGAVDCPVVLAGDFNAPAGSAELTPLHSVLADTFSLKGISFGSQNRYSFPNGHARDRDLDHIFVSRGVVVEDTLVCVDDSAASDHNPVLAEVLVPAGVPITLPGKESLADDMLA